MTARDRFRVELKCSKCERAGTVHLSQEDGWSFLNGNRSTRVDHLPQGFKVVANTNAGEIDIFCTDCGIKVY